MLCVIQWSILVNICYRCSAVFHFTLNMTAKWIDRLSLLVNLCVRVLATLKNHIFHFKTVMFHDIFQRHYECILHFVNYQFLFCQKQYFIFKSFIITNIDTKALLLFLLYFFRFLLFCGSSTCIYFYTKNKWHLAMLETKLQTLYFIFRWL